MMLRKAIHLASILLAFSTIGLVQTASAAEEDLYDFLWLDQDKQVYVLQNKVFKKKNTFNFHAGYLIGLTNEFQDTKGFQVTAGYSLTEQLGLELIYNSYSNSDNDAAKNLLTINQEVPFNRKFKSSYGLLFTWDPFYGKINTFNKIIYFDWSFAAGAGKLDAESNAETVDNSTQQDVFKSESYTAAFFKTAFKIHATERITVSTQLLRTVYKAPGPIVDNVQQEDKWRGNSDFVISIGFSF